MTLIVNIKKKLSQFTLDANFEVEDFRLAILGQSGAGKSILLKCIAGIEKPDEGRIILDGTVLFDSEKKINCPIQQRNIGYLFQDYALFPNMTVEENIAIALQKKGSQQEVKNYIRDIRLTGYENEYPDNLSNGQKQRVALARILISKPSILLLDEPFSALDEHIKLNMELELLEMLSTFNKTVIFVSHNKQEVFHISERTIVLHQGKAGKVKETPLLYQNPSTYSEAMLAGYKNIYRIEDFNFPILCKPITVQDKYVVVPMEALMISLQGSEQASKWRCLQCLNNGDNRYLLCLQWENTKQYLWKYYLNGPIREGSIVYVSIDQKLLFYVHA
jgi:ABC-type spermidine/putrescine transport systems, ATPase components